MNANSLQILDNIKKIYDLGFYFSIGLTRSKRSCKCCGKFMNNVRYIKEIDNDRIEVCESCVHSGKFVLKFKNENN